MPGLTIILAILIFILLIVILLAYWKVVTLPENAPKAFQKNKPESHTRTRIVFAGDSLTHGTVSANYLHHLRKLLPDHEYEFINAGINSDTAYNLLQRIESIINCQPDVITILIGTNDVHKLITPQAEAAYRKRYSVPATYSILDWYSDQLTRILQHFQQRTNARLILISLPMLGEDLSTPLNQLVKVFNQQIQQIATQFQASYLPLHEQLTAQLNPSLHPLPMTPIRWRNLLVWSIVLHYLAGISWNNISQIHHMELMTDQIHLNDTAAALLARLIGTSILNNQSS